jgi:hypothetical protein
VVVILMSFFEVEVIQLVTFLASFDISLAVTEMEIDFVLIDLGEAVFTFG